MPTNVNWLDFDAKPNFGISIVADAAAMNALTQTKGRVVYRSDLSATNPMYGYDGAAWVALGGGGSSTGTDNTTFTIDEDNVGAAVNTLVSFERGSTGGNSNIQCTGSNGAISIMPEGNQNFIVASAYNESVVGMVFNDSALKTKISSEGPVGTKNMVFEVETGQSFVFRTVV